MFVVFVLSSATLYDILSEKMRKIKNKDISSDYFFSFYYMYSLREYKPDKTIF